ncbi:hypothetical protein GOP47_0027110 [Adiantum capillus-veneris]|nr:hypothetical protein GOP47_0027110 [Adiantum capillus-veneris]
MEDEPGFNPDVQPFAEAVGHGNDSSTVNPDSTIEILVDDSDLIHEGLELSITFEKTDQAEGQQSELADHLDGVEVRVSLDATQAVGVEVVSSCHDNEELLQSGDLPDRNLWVLGTETNTHILPSESFGDIENRDATVNCTPTLPSLDLGNGIVERHADMEKCEEGDGNQGSEKKRSREEVAEEGRCLKLKTIEVKEKEVEDPPKKLAERTEHVKPDPVNDYATGSRHTESQYMVSDMLEPVKNKNNDETKSTGSNVCMDGTVDEAKEACFGQGMDDKQCGNESTELAPLHCRVNNKENTVDEAVRTRPRKKRKIAMLLAYCGAGYQGMQKNPGAVTIEGLLEEALLKAGAMPENYDGNPRKVDWMRAARTDKGVSAVGQVVSGLFYIDPPGFVERVNAHLPKQIRLLGYKRVIPTFSAKKYCDRRRYEYVIPIFALDPSTHRDREAVLASEGKEDAFAKCQECSERGRKIPAGKVFRKLSPDGAKAHNCDGQSAALESQSTYEPTTDIRLSMISSSGEQPHQEDNSEEAKPPADLKGTKLAPLEEEDVKQGSLGASPDLKKEPFHFGDAERARLNRILSHYVGTHNFHNFTSRVKAEDPSAKRYMVSFEAGDVFTVGGTEFVSCTVIGQSFMLHQIRKMIGLAIAVFRGFAPESILETALRRDTNITIPTAPELGLFLDECMYPAYNQKWYNTHEEVSQKGHEQEINSFRHSVIYEHIAMAENKEGSMALFLHSLNDRNYADLASAREAAVKLASSS